MPNTKILAGDCIESLKKLPDASVNCCVTSPPYFGLRDYGTADWEGGDPNCQHIERIAEHKGQRADRDQTANIFKYKGECKTCGAKSVDKQIGLEETPEEFVAKLVAVFREVRRVLKDDGTCWVNMGDSYSGSGKGPAGNLGKEHDERNMEKKHSSIIPRGCKPKDLIGVPWMLAFALRADGWYLRQDIIWHKPNPMPESVTDRCTKAHEYIFLLSKSKQYYFDGEAIKTEAKSKSEGIRFGGNKYGDNDDVKFATKSGNVSKEYNKANKRSVWSVNTKSYREAHFATYPPELITPCILAGCPEGGTVIDPFGGSGTTAEVAMLNGRNAILCELNPEYVKIIEKRLGKVDPLFNS
jgi:site-specific DNA-methyltransferase (adenine-specific)